MSLLQYGDFVLHSGEHSNWKIDCDALTDSDIKAAAAILAKRIPPFGSVKGIRRGGVRLAAALLAYSTTGPLLIVDDVFTTGASMEEARRAQAGNEAIGVVLFARRETPDWITPLFTTQENRSAP